MARVDIDIVSTSGRTPDLVEKLLGVWRSSVEATHDFLGPADVDRIAGYVPQVVSGVANLAVARDADCRPVGFAGVDGDMLEMLFVDAAWRGRGVGTALLSFAVRELGARRLTVNEQNPAARGFYESRGWTVVGRSEADDQGEPYPLLHMELSHSEPAKGRS